MPRLYQQLAGQTSPPSVVSWFGQAVGAELARWGANSPIGGQAVIFLPTINQ
jgi:hypothetical protein